MLRAALFVVCGILLAAAGWLGDRRLRSRCDPAPCCPGLVLLFALVVERWRYKPVTGRPPGADWVPTNERFVDPESGKLVTVFYQPATGERRYVAG